MADEEQSQEKTEQPSEKRLRESREKGQTARSKDFNALVLLLFSGLAFYLLGQQMAAGMAEVMESSFSFSPEILTTPQMTLSHLSFLATVAGKAIMPLLILIVALSLIGPLLIGGWVFSSDLLMPKFSRMDPIKGVKRIFSLRGLVEMIKAILKFLIVGFVAYLNIKWQLPTLFSLANAPLETAIGTGMHLLITSFVVVAASLILIALLDVPFQLYEHSKQLKMTKQELKDEYKETEGKPEVKSQIRRAQQELARKRMMAEVPKASVVLTNPTHYSVAIRYDQKGNRAPVVVAKGKDLVAMQIRRLAKEAEVPVISVPPLARALYFTTALNAEIPRGLYIAVAQVLAYVFQLKDRRFYDDRPGSLQEVPIPEEIAAKAEESKE